MLARRTRSLLLNAQAAMDAAPAVARVLGKELGRDPAWAVSQIEAFRTIAGGYVVRETSSG